MGELEDRADYGDHEDHDDRRPAYLDEWALEGRGLSWDATAQTWVATGHIPSNASARHDLHEMLELRAELKLQQNRGATLHELNAALREQLQGKREALEKAHADIVVLNNTVDRLEDIIERYRAAGYGWSEC